MTRDMITNDYQDLRFCSCCRNYVHYLQSLDASFCVECGNKVSLFSPDDMRAFRDAALRDSVSAKPKPGIPAHRTGKTVA